MLLDSPGPPPCSPVRHSTQQPVPPFAGMVCPQCTVSPLREPAPADPLIQVSLHPLPSSVQPHPPQEVLHRGHGPPLCPRFPSADPERPVPLTLLPLRAAGVHSIPLWFVLSVACITTVSLQMSLKFLLVLALPGCRSRLACQACCTSLYRPWKEPELPRQLQSWSILHPSVWSALGCSGLHRVQCSTNNH